MFYFLEGNIGSGKTTLLDSLTKKGFHVIYEPVDEWIKLGLLDCFYSDMKRWGYTFQNGAFITKMLKLMDLDPNINYIVERSPFTDKNCFAKIAHETGNLNDMEWKLYNIWFDDLIKKLGDKENIRYIYLKTNYKICDKRIKQRSRNEESSIAIDYLTTLENSHQSWMDSIDIDHKLVLDGSLELNDIDDHIQKIHKFMETS
jgi:deoxyadenosine/deoxycytidine kinase